MLSETLYEKLTNDDGRVFEDISDGARSEAPKSFSLILLSLFLTKLGDSIASPKTTLVWMVTAVGAPGWVMLALDLVFKSLSRLLFGGSQGCPQQDDSEAETRATDRLVIELWPV